MCDLQFLGISDFYLKKKKTKLHLKVEIHTFSSTSFNPKHTNEVV